MKLSIFPFGANGADEGLCTLCNQIPFGKLFDPRQFDNRRQLVSFHPVDHIDSEK